MSDGPHSEPASRMMGRRATRGERIAAGMLAFGCLTVLFTAAWLHADDNGRGTHTQLGLSECAWAEHFDAPCATCGMTTSFALAADGRWATSIAAQPFGAVMALFVPVMFWGALHVAATGSRLGTAVAPMLTGRLLTVVVIVFLVSWVYKWATW